MTLSAIRKKIVNAINRNRSEEYALLRFMRKLDLAPGHRILDVGCGFGQKTRLLTSKGFKVEGVDINPEIVRQNRDAGIACRMPEELGGKTFDVILMLHVIEHFQPADLLSFLDAYLARLKPGGHLVIATPLLGHSFYLDFDHIRPYNPIGLNMVFGGDATQVQYYAKNRIKLIDLWFRRSPFQVRYFPGIYLKTRSQMPVVFNLILTIIFRLSFGLIGRTTAWMGLYRKVEPSG